MEKGEELADLKFRLHYVSGKETDFVVDNLYNFVHIGDDNVIKIENGKIKANKTGETELTLNYDGRSASYKFCVVEDKESLYFDGFEVIPATKTLYFNGTSDKSIDIAIKTPEDIDYSVSFASKDKAVAKVSKNGKVTAAGEGTTYIITKITIGNISKDFKTKIVSKKASLNIISSKKTLKVGESFTFKAKSYGLKGNPAWSVSDSKILKIDSRTGKATAKKAGTVYITVKNGKFTDKIKVKVVI